MCVCARERQTETAETEKATERETERDRERERERERENRHHSNATTPPTTPITDLICANPRAHAAVGRRIEELKCGRVWIM